MEYDHHPVYFSTPPVVVIVMIVLAAIGFVIGIWAGSFLF
jgi:hypothetical protein